MKKRCGFVFFIFAVLSLISCQKYLPTAPQSGPGDGNVPLTRTEQIALDLINRADWPLDESMPLYNSTPASLAKFSGNRIMSFIRQPITGNIVHYAFQIPVGPGPFDVIGIHRVVKEKSPTQPMNTRQILFLQHGDAKDFVGMFVPGLYGTSFDMDFGFAVYMAKKNVDVWGIDQAWTLVPGGQPDCSFMADWGIQKQVDDLNLAISVARAVRKFMGMGYHKVLLSGYSSGVLTGYALLNQETQLPEASRQVAGYIPVDCPFKSDDPDILQVFGNECQMMESLIAGGQYHLDSPFPVLGPLARQDPDGPSPIFPGFTNMQAALFFGAGQIFGDNVAIHYLSGIFQNGFPVDLRYCTIPQWLDFMASGPAYMSVQFIVDYETIMTDVGDSPFDDYLSQIEIPILNVAAVGGLGQSSVYTNSLLGSTDITNLIVSTGTPTLVEEIGHIDIFISGNAEKLFWRPIYDWVKAHTSINYTNSDKFVADAE
ncbi:hypothetical protein JW935_14205 [candidate division KSB1 bacterium]|nr:hypothetical protein [candidate division KSB1 bacterium]